MKPILYKQYVDHTYAKTKRDETDKLFDTFNSCHSNTKLIIEENEPKFLNTKITRKNGETKTSVMRKLEFFSLLAI